MTAAVFLINERRRDVRDEINVRNQLAGAAAEGDHDDDVDDEMSWAVSLSFSLFLSFIRGNLFARGDFCVTDGDKWPISLISP